MSGKENPSFGVGPVTQRQEKTTLYETEVKGYLKSISDAVFAGLPVWGMTFVSLVVLLVLLQVQQNLGRQYIQIRRCWYHSIPLDCFSVNHGVS